MENLLSSAYAISGKILNDSSGDSRIHCGVGVMAFNEEANIARTLQSLLNQRTTTCSIDQIVVVCSGCTDQTEAIVTRFCEEYPLIKLLVQNKREGKASAINLLLSYLANDIIVSVGADTIPSPEAIQRLVEPFENPEVGMTGGHPIPVNNPNKFIGFTVHILWELHHQIAKKTPKMGELTAFRKIFQRIPVRSSVDEAAMEPLIYGQGYKLCYVPEAVVFNRGPDNVSDFLKQRRRIYSGHLKISKIQGYRVTTMSSLNILSAILKTWKWNWRYLFWFPGTILLEMYARFLGWIDYKLKKKEHTIWERINTTKVV